MDGEETLPISVIVDLKAVPAASSIGTSLRPELP